MRPGPVTTRLLIIGSALIVAGCSTPPISKAPRPLQHAPLTSDQADGIAIHALGLVGTPYRYGGNTIEGGFDCSGLIAFVYRSSTGRSPPRTVAELAGFGQPVANAARRSGDLLLFGNGTPTHAGIYVGNGRFVHAPSNGGAVRLDRLDGPYWGRQALTVRRP